MVSGKINEKVETRKSREENVPSASVVASFDEVKFEMLMKTMEKLMDRMIVNNMPVNS